MGIYDREYYRSAPRSAGGGFGKVCKWLIAINVAVYVLQILTHRTLAPAFEFSTGDDGLPRIVEGRGIGGVTRWLELDPLAVFSRLQLWRLVTCAFCHSFSNAEALPWHLLVNMLLLWWFGPRMEALYGSAEFLRFYLTSAVVASVCFLALSLVLGDVRPMIGASGAVGAVLMLYATYHPRDRILLFFLIPLEIRWVLALYVVYDLYPVLLALGGAAVRQEVAHAAHLGGFAYGFLYRHFDLRYYRLFPNGCSLGLPSLKRWFRRPQVRIYREPEPDRLDEDFDAKVDRVLEKISRSGTDSLTTEEKRVLERASLRYRKQQTS